ncbi:short subunit dehydrogenase-like uncharacterized protein [Rhodococcus opacus]|nr:short subunit dehydrogenase-like uncharacterized protein [Rhodococcus opacus]
MKIVHSCGYDSIPSDLGVHVLHQKVQADDAGELTDTTLVASLSGGVSGGTIDTLRTQIDVSRMDAALRRLAASPYSLSPDRTKEPDLGRQSDVALVDGTDIAPETTGWKAPFVMGSYNTRIVRRSNALQNWAYGRTFKYREVMSVGDSPLSRVYAAGVAAILGGLVLGLSVPPTRYVLDRILPAPGEGPSDKTTQRLLRDGHLHHHHDRRPVHLPGDGTGRSRIPGHRGPAGGVGPEPGARPRPAPRRGRCPHPGHRTR